MRRITEKDIGKRITFRAVTRWNTRKATRKVIGIDSEFDRVLVNFGGYKGFYVRQSEILEVHP